MNILKIVALIISLTVGLNSASAQLLGIEGEQATSVGVYIQDLTSGEALYDYNSEIAMTPASVMKSVTTATALSLLGDNFRFATTVELRGGFLADKSWQGDLVIRSSGDPTLESENFEENLGFCDSICASLRRIGVKKINGTIVVEQTLKDAGPVAQWEIEDIAWPYGAGLFGLNYMDNTCLLYPVSGKTKPYVPGLEITIKETDGLNDLLRGVNSNKLTVYRNRKIAKYNKWAVATTMPDPSAVFVAQLKSVLRSAGIGVGQKALADSEAEIRNIYTHFSPASAEIMRSLMFRSDNLFAEGVLRMLAPEGSRKDAIEKEKALWNKRGIDSNFALIFDGSGLARGNRLQARFIADVLEYMATDESMSRTYVSFFPKAGMDGTMKSFLEKSPLKGKIALKTGSMNAVQSYAGYKLDDDGKPTHVIVVLVNGFFCKRAELKKSIENLLIETFQ